MEKYALEFSFLAINQIRIYFLKTNQRTDLVSTIKKTFEKLNYVINNALKSYSPNKNINFPYLNREYIIFYKSFVKLELENLCKYIENKKVKNEKKIRIKIKILNEQLQQKIEQIKVKNEQLQQKNEQIKTKNEQLQQKNEQIKTKNEQLQQKNDQIKAKNEQLQQKNDQIKTKNEQLKQKNNEIQNLHIQNNIQGLSIKRLQNSWSYRIGRLFTYPLSIPLDFYRFIRDYNVIKKSGLFDSEYYLSQNEDVKNAKMNPIKHYLKFGWKEGRNPSAEFDGNEYLNKRPDVIVAGICPLVHYIKFGRDKK